MDIGIPKIKGRASLYRSLGIIGSISTMILSIIWIILCIIAMSYYFVGGPYDVNNKPNILTPYGVSFSRAYFNMEYAGLMESYLDPLIVFCLVLVYCFLSINLLIASVHINKEFRIWINSNLIRKRSVQWILSSMVMCIYELIFAIIFFVDNYVCTRENGGEYIAAAAVTMATLSMKGYFMWGLNSAITFAMFHIHYFKKSECPV